MRSVIRDGSDFAVTLGNAPTSWGIESPANPEYPSWSSVLDEVAGSGYGGIELGPYGFLPTDPETLRSELATRRLALTAGTLMEPLHVLEERVRILEAAERTCLLLATQGAPYLVIIGALSRKREATAGRSEIAPRLDPVQLEAALETIDLIADVAIRHGIVPAVHPHAGTYIEFADEISAIHEGSRKEIQFCVDTGHSTYAGCDPIGLIQTLGSRVAYVHLKDVNPVILAEARRDDMGFWAAYAAGIFCELGRGVVDFMGVFRALRDIGYRGWLTVEQDARPGRTKSPSDSARSNRLSVYRLVKELQHSDL